MAATTVELIRVLGDAMVRLSNLIFLGYAIHVITTHMFAYLNHRLDVLGKDALVFYPRDRYSETPTDTTVQ